MCVYVCFLYVVDFFVNITLDRNRRFTSKSDTGHNIKIQVYLIRETRWLKTMVD